MCTCVAVTETQENRLCFSFRVVRSQLTIYTQCFTWKCCTGGATDDEIAFGDCGQYELGKHDFFHNTFFNDFHYCFWNDVKI